ncbi:uncharacterized protein LOC101235913 isoform X2 [Hydra vulgaris]|uniref:uncharacterized protein LOC101235913 isoform X2 n=1 Tax=Hydra vulgaris TaxID=6087 RepID=UPI0032E9F284
MQMVLHFYIVWQTSIVTSFIVRLPCNLYAKFTKTQDTYMTGNIIKSLTNANSSDCAVACVTNSNCSLVNWKEDELLCELISGSSPQQTAKNLWMVLQPDNTNNQIVGRICEQVNPCDITQTCRDVCDSLNKHTFSCLLSNDASRGGTASISSTWDSVNTAASKAIDGSVTTTAITGNSLNEHWFKLDLNYVYQINQIVVYNRIEYLPSRMNGNKLIVNINDQYINVPEIAVLTSDLKQTITGSFIGRYIFIVRDSSDLLQVAEINVFV